MNPANWWEKHDQKFTCQKTNCFHQTATNFSFLSKNCGSVFAIFSIKVHWQDNVKILLHFLERITNASTADQWEKHDQKFREREREREREQQEQGGGVGGSEMCGYLAMISETYPPPIRPRKFQILSMETNI